MEKTSKVSQSEEDLILNYLWAHIEEGTYDEIAIKGGRVLGLWRTLDGGWRGHETIGEASEILPEAKKWEEMAETESMALHIQNNKQGLDCSAPAEGARVRLQRGR